MWCGIIFTYSIISITSFMSLHNMGTKIKNTSTNVRKIVIVTRESVKLDPGDEIEFDGDLELES